MPVAFIHIWQLPAFHFAAIFLLLLLVPGSLNAGPPFLTDDPEPVDFKHWEYYIASINTYQPGLATGTLPHFEVNYGPLPNLQLHLILPMNFESMGSHSFREGYGDTELGVKYRFIQEKDNIPQIGTFPIIEVPTVNNPTFTNGKVKVFIPIWLQKSWGKLTSYGGGGYWFNPGSGNKNWVFAGWELQYDFSEPLTLGGEIYYNSAPVTGGSSTAGFNLGGFLNFSEKFHFIFSVGHSLMNDRFFTSYGGLLWTI